jgi:uncharacterized protein (DUF1501 family)
MPRKISRRQFLVASGVVGGAALGAGATAVAFSRLAAAGKTNPLPVGSGILVLVTLYGGNDGLNTVIPFQDKTYYAQRPDLAYDQSVVLPLSDGMGLNPSMTGFKKQYDAGRLAVVRGVGYPSPDRSHFRSMAIWQTGSPDSVVPTGWLGRWLDANGTDPLLAVNVGPVLPPMLAGHSCAGAAVPSSGSITLPSGTYGQALRSLDTASTATTAVAQRVAQSGADLQRVATTLGPALAARANAVAGAGSAAANGNDLGSQLDIVAACIAANAPTRIYSVSLGGFDTHADEKDAQSRLLGQVDSAVCGFAGKVAGGPHGPNVVVAIYSEFGRRVAANASQGTDHGTASNVFVLGNSVTGGLYGEQPSLTDLDQGDLKYNVDFRSVYATLLERTLGTDADNILATAKLPRLAFV